MTWPWGTILGGCTGPRGAGKARIIATALGVVLSMVPTTAAAGELGYLGARLGDTERLWFTITTERRGRTDASAMIRLGPRLTEIHVQGYPGREFTSRDVFSVETRYIGHFAPGMVPMSVDILYMPDGMGGPFWTSNGAGFAPVVRVLELDVWGAVGEMDMLFFGELCLKPYISAATDPETCREVSGRVVTELFVQRGPPHATRPNRGP